MGCRVESARRHALLRALRTPLKGWLEKSPRDLSNGKPLFTPSTESTRGAGDSRKHLEVAACPHHADLVPQLHELMVPGIGSWLRLTDPWRGGETSLPFPSGGGRADDTPSPAGRLTAAHPLRA